MTTAYDVPAAEFISKVAEKLKENDKIVPPEWAEFVKTGVHKELPPVEEDWWFTRCAAILRAVYMEGPIGVERLSSIYGGKQNRGSKPHRKAKGSGSVIRTAVQQLEDAGYVCKTETEGRIVSPAGRSFVDNTAYEVKNEIIESYPELSKY
ncbi:30S ribosomal protein S19e [Methanosarcinaceae archaeon]|nr:30S ribosomal protein S19e [Methanosarcinaceae archaeon]MBQ3620301.1 30S ribosomal protein S19e [Methanosarcinaceae archaeon]